MSTQQILGVVGTVVGAYFGYPQLGFVVGSLVGAALTPKQKTEGPRLDDLKVTVSTYGAGIPTIYGSGRLGGNVIWSTDKIEIPTTTSTGKGGGSENTTYQAFVHMAVALCYGPIIGIRKIWKDGKLIYDATSGISIGSALASAKSPYSFATLYLGTETQLPDPIQEIYLGIGNAPAYRGMAYIQLNAVECPGGRVPQFSFEVVTDGVVQVVKTELHHFADSVELHEGMGGIVGPYGANHWRADEPVHANPRSMFGSLVGSGFITPQMSLAYRSVNAGPSQPISIVGGDPAFLQLTHETAGDTADGLVSVFRIGVEPVTDVLLFTIVSPGETLYGYDWAAYDETTSKYALGPIAGSPASSLIVDMALVAKPADGFGPIAYYGGLLYLLKSDGTSLNIWDGTTWAAPIAVPVPVSVADATPLVRANSDGVFVLVSYSDGVGGIWKLNGATFVELTDDVAVIAPDSAPAGTRFYTSFYSNSDYAIIGPNDLRNGDYSYTMIRFRALTANEVLVSDIISSQCLRAGLTAGQFDVSTVSDTVHGYTIANPASARNNIQPLMTGYGIDAREEDGKIKFFKRSAITSVVTVPYVELGCVEGEGDAGDPMPLSHGQEAELPRAVNVNFISPDFDYQTGTERASRQVTESQLDQTMDLPISTNADHAASVAQMILYDAWNERNKRSLKVSRKYAAVSAGDGVTIEYPQGVNQRWRITKATDTGVLCEWEVVPADESIYTQTAIGAPGYAGQGQQVAPLPTPTRMQLIDGPILRDQDDNAGLYVAAEGYGAGWRGYTLYVGDDATNLQSRGGVTTPASIGFAEDALGGWTGGLMDETNSVIVSMGTDDVLNSTTRDLMFTSSVNLALIGDNGRWEAIQFRTATDLGGGRYMLTSVLRGLFGTERNTGTHAAGDRFILMSVDGMLRPSLDFGSIGQEFEFRPVSLGDTLQSGVSQIYANTAEGLKPRSPWDLRKSNAASNDQTLTWERRTRLSSNALRGIVPLGETSEAYSLDFYTSNAFDTVGGTLDSTTRSLTITSAQQTAFGLTPGAALYMRVYQISQSVGRGAPLEATV